MKRTMMLMLAVLVAAGFVAGCGGEETVGREESGKIRAVATYSILGDLVRNVGGKNVELTTLVGPDGDAHTFEPKPSDGEKLSGADVVFENGLGFETWMDDLYGSTGSGADRIVVSEGIRPLAAAEGSHGAGGEIGARLLVADGEDARVGLVDTTTGASEVFETGAPAHVNASGDGRYGYAVQPEGNVVEVVDGGAWAEDHGDHVHVYGKEPRMLDHSFRGDEPVHLVSHDGRAAIFNDGTGSATLFDEEDLEKGKPETTTIETGTPHHGVAVPVDEDVILSEAEKDEEGDLPSKFSVRDSEGRKKQRFGGCEGMHGEVSLGTSAFFACGDGILVLEKEGEKFSDKKIPYPEGVDEETRSWTLLGEEEGRYLIGDSGEDGLMRIDPEGGAKRLPLPEKMGEFALAEDGDRVLVLTVDGNLHAIDPESGASEWSVPAAERFSLKGGFEVPRPSVAAGHDAAYVSDPATGRITEVSLEEMRVANEFDVGGRPTGIAVLGSEAEEHAHEEDGHSHDDHDHGHGRFDPHVWTDVNNARTMVGNIRDALVAADPEDAEDYRRNAEEYIEKLEKLDGWAVDRLASVPEERRVIFTSHDTFGYFGERYGYGVDDALGSVSTEASDTSAGETARLVKEIEASGVPTIFAENVSNTNLMQNIAAEAEVELAPTLYTDALGEPGSDGETYVEMVRHNVATISEGLKR